MMQMAANQTVTKGPELKQWDCTPALDQNGTLRAVTTRPR